MPAASIADALWYRRRPSGLREDTDESPTVHEFEPVSM